MEILMWLGKQKFSWGGERCGARTHEGSNPFA